MTSPIKFPFFAKASLVLIGLYVFISILSILQGIILPFIFATIIAILISPVVSFLVRKRLNRALAIGIVLIVSLGTIAMIIALLTSQTSRLSDALPLLTTRFENLIEQSVIWASGYFDISPQKINAWLSDAKAELMNKSGILIGSTLSTMGGVLAAVFLTPVYIFMLLFYQAHLIEFIHKVFGSSNDSKVSEILTETKTIIQSYLLGLFAEFGIVAIMNSAGLLILGIDYAILLGIFGAFLNFIPYLGGAIGVVLFMIVALLTKPPVYALYVLALYVIIQFIDNNYIVPKIVGSKVKLNALICLLAVIAGAALWGIPGMFLSIPLIAIIKLIFDRLEPLKPWGFLLGDTTPPLIKIKIKKIKNEKHL